MSLALSAMTYFEPTDLIGKPDIRRSGLKVREATALEGHFLACTG
jgi:hypothetical protein